MEKKTIPHIRRSKEKLTMLTAYDYWTGQLVDQAGADMILVGDSLGMVIQGHENTLSVTLDDMIYHSKLVVRARKSAVVVGDMPYLTYHVSPEETIRNAGRFIQEAGVDAVKLEGGRNRIPMIEAITNAEIPVMGHLGLTPQSVNAMGGYKVQGKKERDRERLIEDALALQEAGVFSMVLECIPYDLAGEITELLSVPTIGIGAGPYCSGQVLVIHDLLGMAFRESPKFVRQFANLTEVAGEAVTQYIEETKSGSFPTLEESYRSLNKRTNGTARSAISLEPTAPVAAAC